VGGGGCVGVWVRGRGIQVVKGRGVKVEGGGQQGVRQHSDRWLERVGPSVCLVLAIVGGTWLGVWMHA
jgi:hypothetical protein